MNYNERGDAPDAGLRAIALKAQAGAPLSGKLWHRLAQRQSVEANNPGAYGIGSSVSGGGGGYGSPFAPSPSRGVWDAIDAGAYDFSRLQHSRRGEYDPMASFTDAEVIGGASASVPGRDGGKVLPWGSAGWQGADGVYNVIGGDGRKQSFGSEQAALGAIGGFQQKRQPVAALNPSTVPGIDGVAGGERQPVSQMNPSTVPGIDGVAGGSRQGSFLGGLAKTAMSAVFPNSAAVGRSVADAVYGKGTQGTQGTQGALGTQGTEGTKGLAGMEALAPLSERLEQHRQMLRSGAGDGFRGASAPAQNSIASLLAGSRLDPRVQGRAQAGIDALQGGFAAASSRAAAEGRQLDAQDLAELMARVGGQTGDADLLSAGMRGLGSRSRFTPGLVNFGEAHGQPVWGMMDGNGNVSVIKNPRGLGASGVDGQPIVSEDGRFYMAEDGWKPLSAQREQDPFKAQILFGQYQAAMTDATREEGIFESAKKHAKAQTDAKQRANILAGQLGYEAPFPDVAAPRAKGDGASKQISNRGPSSLGGAGGTVPGALSGEDLEAFQWAQKNPDDPRAAQILRRLGR